MRYRLSSPSDDANDRPADNSVLQQVRNILERLLARLRLTELGEGSVPGPGIKREGEKEGS